MQYGLDTAAAAYYSSNNGSNAPYAQEELNRLSKQSPGDVQYNEEYADGDWGGDLPHVDDLEVAAAAAEEELEAQKQRLRAAQSMKKSSDDSDSSEESSDDDSDSDSDVECIGAELRQEQFEMESPGPVSVNLRVSESETVDLQLTFRKVSMEEGDSDVGSEIFDAGELGKMLEQMEDDGVDARAARDAKEAGLPPLAPLNVTISPDDKLLAAGYVSAVLGPQIIVQAPENGQPVDEGSVLCLADRRPLGRVEEVFGPVEAPLYMLRYSAGGGALPDLAVGAAVCSVERLNSYVFPEGIRASAGEALDEDVEECDFSDDDAEALFQRQAACAPSVSYSRDQPLMTSWQPGGWSRGRAPTPSNGRGRGARGKTPRNPFARGAYPQASAPRQTAQQATNMSEGQHQRGRGRGGLRGRHGAHAQGVLTSPSQGPQHLPPSGPPPFAPAQGQWVWVPPEQLQHMPQQPTRVPAYVGAGNIRLPGGWSNPGGSSHQWSHAPLRQQYDSQLGSGHQSFYPQGPP